MLTSCENLHLALQSAFDQRLGTVVMALDELTLTVSASDYSTTMQTLRDEPGLAFEQLIDLCGIDYSTYREGDSVLASGMRFAVVSHLLSLTHNWRLRVRVFAQPDELPVVPSVCSIWGSANWYEREAFDLFGIVFAGHEDLRRLLTDYGFIGHPLRKDFPVSGHVEMLYDPQQKRVVYQPVTIEPREITPRILREEGYAGLKP